MNETGKELVMFQRKDGDTDCHGCTRLSIMWQSTANGDSIISPSILTGVFLGA